MTNEEEKEARAKLMDFFDHRGRIIEWLCRFGEMTNPDDILGIVNASRERAEQTVNMVRREPEVLAAIESIERLTGAKKNAPCVWCAGPMTAIEDGNWLCPKCWRTAGSSGEPSK